MVRGKIFVHFKGDDLGLLGFTRNLIKDRNGMEAEYENWQFLGATRDQVDQLITDALELATAE